jgi:membrane dipeptidase
MFYTEQDPLLPRDKGMPGIRDSHPPGINRNGEHTTNHASRKSRNAFNDSMTVVLALCSAIIFTMLFLPTNLIGGLFDHRWRFGHQEPLSIQERVNRILTDTPLIGISGIL